MALCGSSICTEGTVYFCSYRITHTGAWGEFRTLADSESDLGTLTHPRIHHNMWSTFFATVYIITEN
jgi:hypothetical protein